MKEIQMLNWIFFFKKNENNTSVGKVDEQEGRKLSERENLCIGLSSEGYHYIKKVIDELEEESGVKDISINCISKTLNIGIILFILFFYLFWLQFI